jgi:O-antigen/teichoic acid export membrane protein
MGYFEKRFPPGGFVRNVLALLTGSVLGQLVTVAAAPILTRLYTPDEFGSLALYTSIVAVVSVVLCWRYDFAIVLPEEPKDGANLLILSIMLVVGMSLVSVPLVAMFRNHAAAALGAPGLSDWFWALPISFAAMGIYQALNSWCVRKKHFKNVAYSRVGQSSATAGVQIAASPTMSPGPGGLIIGHVAGSFTAMAILTVHTIRNDFRRIGSALDWRRMRAAAARYKKYPIYSTWPAFINTFALSLPVLFLTRFFDAAIVGQYALSVRILQMPLNLIGASIGRVYFQRLAEEKNRTGDISSLVEKTFIRLLAMAVPGCLVLMLLAPAAFELIFGSQWRPAGEYTRILAPAMAIRFVTSPLTTAFGVSNRQEVAAKWQISQLVSTCFFLCASLLFVDPVATIYALAINDVMLYVIYLTMVFRIARASFRRAFASIPGLFGR